MVKIIKTTKYGNLMGSEKPKKRDRHCTYLKCPLIFDIDNYITKSYDFVHEIFIDKMVQKMV